MQFRDLLGPNPGLSLVSSPGRGAWAEGMGPRLPERGPPSGQQCVEGSLLGRSQPGAALQVLQHMGVRGHNAGCVHVTHQDPKEQEVGSAEPRGRPSLQDSRSATAWPHGPSAHPVPPKEPTRQAKATCWRAALWSGRLASSSMSP